MTLSEIDQYTLSEMRCACEREINGACIKLFCANHQRMLVPQWCHEAKQAHHRQGRQPWWESFQRQKKTTDNSHTGHAYYCSYGDTESFGVDPARCICGAYQPKPLVRYPF